MQDTVPEDFFRICHYDLKEPASSALACDDEYLYLCIASRNGGIYKIGTGNGLTKAGKVYNYRQMTMAPEHMKMVIIGDTIYRSFQGCEFATVKTNNKHTLEPTGDIELNCPLIRSDPVNPRINKFVPIMTDGKHLYAIFKSLDLEPLEQPPKKLAVPEPDGTLKPPEPARHSHDELMKAMERLGGLKPPMPSDSGFHPVSFEAKIQNLPFGAFMKSDIEPPEFLQKRISRKESKDVKAPPMPVAPGLLQPSSISQPPVSPMPAPVPISPSEPVPFFASEGLEAPQLVPVPQVQPQQNSNSVEIDPFLLELIESYFTPERETEIADRWNKAYNTRKTKFDKAANKNAVSRKPSEVANLQFNKSSLDKPPVCEAKKKRMPRPDKKPVTKTTQPAPEPEKDRHGVMNFWLYKYNLSHSLDEIKEEEFRDNQSVIELYESFSSLFSMKECARAFKLSQEDIVLAAQWLIEEGEKQRNKKCINYEQVTLLAQGEIDPKSIKSKGAKQPPEEVTLTHSIINDRLLQDECIYYEGTILIGRNLYFSADPNDEYELPEEIIPQIMQDKKFITPERNRATMQSYLRNKDFFGKADDKMDPASMLDMSTQMKHYYDNIINITKELGHLRNQDEEIIMVANRQREMLESKIQAMNIRMSLDPAGVPEGAPDQAKANEGAKTEEKKPDPKKVKKLRGTFICKVGSALERQEAFAPRCYDWKYNILYAVTMVKKHNWVQNPSMIVKSRDPISYQKVFEFINQRQDHHPKGKIFFDGTKEIEYGHTENDPSIIEEQRKYFERYHSQLSSLESVKELRYLLNDLFALINSKRFSLPFKTSNPIKALTKMQKDLDSQIKRTSNVEEKKSLQSKRAKISMKIMRLEKLNKDSKKKLETEKKDMKPMTKDGSASNTAKSPETTINPTKFSDSVKQQKPSAPKDKAEIEENKKHYSFCPVGSGAELESIFKKLRESVSLRNEESIDFYSRMLLFWSYHISITVSFKKAQELATYLVTEIEEERFKPKILSIFESVLVRMVYLISSDSDIIQRILRLALKKKSTVSEQYEEIREKINALEYTQLSKTRTTLLEKAYIILCRVKHYDVYHVFNQSELNLVLNENTRSRQNEPRHKLTKTFGLNVKESESIAEVPESALFQLLVQLQESIMDNAVNTDLLLKWRIYYGHHFNVWTLLESKAREEKVQKLINEFVSITISFVERYVEVIEKDNLKNVEVFSFILEYILCMMNIATCYLINSKSSTKIMIDADFLVNKNLKIMNTLMKVFKKVDALAQGKISAQLKLNNEGVDINQQNIFETCHPLNRGETAKTNVLNFPDALGVVVQLDKRCHSDSGKDFLLMHSWDSSQGPTPARSELNINSGSSGRLYIGIGFRVSGKLKNEESFILLGDSAKLVFEANPKCLDNDQSLKRWGYRMRSLPIYSYESTLLATSESKNGQFSGNLIASKHRGFGLVLIQLISRMTVTLLREIDMFMKGRRVSIEEKRLNKYLQWTLMKSGLNSLRRDLFLQDQKQGLKFTQKMKDSVGRAIISSNGEEMSKGRSIDETEKMSNQSKGDLEKEFLQDSQLSELLTKLQSNDSTLMELFSTIKGLQDIPRMLKMEKMRPTFTKELQRRWENSENLILLAMLHHSGLLKLLLSSSASKGQVTNLLALDSVKDQLVAICAKKNEVMNKMVVELQTEREYLQTLESMVEVLKTEKDAIISEREKKVADEALKASILEERSKIEETAGDSKDSKKAKLEELQKKYCKKKVAKKSDFVKPKKDKDPKKKEKVEVKKTPEEKEPVEEKKEPELKIEEEKKTPELFFESLLEKPDVKEKLQIILKENRVSEANNIEFIMASRSLPYQADDMPSNINELMNHLRSILIKSESDTACIENPYIRVSAKVDERCFFLLKIATSPAKSGEDKADIQEEDDKSYDIEGDGDEDLQPMDITRSLSSTGPGFRKNSNRLESRMEGLEKRVDILGEWINSYKKWKASANSEQSLDSEKCSFLVSISSFLTQQEPLDIKKLEKVLLRIAQRACFRAFGLDMIKDFLNFAHDTWLSKYLTGVFSSPFK